MDPRARPLDRRWLGTAKRSARSRAEESGALCDQDSSESKTPWACNSCDECRERLGRAHLQQVFARRCAAIGRHSGLVCTLRVRTHACATNAMEMLGLPAGGQCILEEVLKLSQRRLP